MSKHTPGPWHSWHENSYSVIGVAVHGETGFREIAKVYDNSANAQLIAAAPELLEACRLAILRLDQLDDSGDIGPSENYKAILAAIEKATNP